MSQRFGKQFHKLIGVMSTTFLAELERVTNPNSKTDFAVTEAFKKDCDGWARGEFTVPAGRNMPVDNR